jgi:DNA-binding CsgD family transcriptional regulator
MHSEVEHGREACRQHAWDEAREALLAADRAAALDGDDLERLAVAAYLTGHEPLFVATLERAHDAHAAARPQRAARCAFWLGLTAMFRGEGAQASGWLARAERELEGLDCAERGWLLLPPAEQQLRRNDPAAAAATASRAAALGERFADVDLVACARHVEARALIGAGRIDDGLKLLDEVMLTLAHGEMAPLVTGLVYCSVIEACRLLCELERAGDWTAALERWCARQHGLVAFTGACRVHRAENLQWHGAWLDALDEAAHAAGAGGRAAGEAMLVKGDLHRLRGDFSAAQQAYREASRFGCEPQPGLALLRLSQGRGDVALAAIRRVAGQAVAPLERARLLPAAVEIALATGGVDVANDAATELEHVVARFPTPALAARAAQARGAVELAQGRAQAALGPLRRALEAWLQLDAPYDAARVRVLLAQACRALGDDDAAEIERDAAHAAFERLGAAPDMEQLKPRAARGRTLTGREVQVLRLVAAGRTNKEIANALALSERTVDRHMSNICDKLDVSSRAAATACAYEGRLL